MARKYELTITLHTDTVQQGGMAPVMVAASSKDPITDVIIWQSPHKAADPNHPWASVIAVTGNKTKDALMTQPIQIPLTWFPIVIDVYEDATATETPDFHRTSEIAYDATKKDRSFQGAKREDPANKDKDPTDLKGNTRKSTP
jgi:hypothetical protein